MRDGATDMSTRRHIVLCSWEGLWKMGFIELLLGITPLFSMPMEAYPETAMELHFNFVKKSWLSANLFSRDAHITCVS